MIMDFIKKNLHIILSATIAIVALTLLVPTIIARGRIADALEESTRQGKDVQSEIRSAVGTAQFEIAKQYYDSYAADANTIKNLAVQTSQRTILSYKIFPDPNETSIQIFNEFGDAYKKTFASFIIQLNALDVPTDIEISKKTGSGVATGTARSRTPRRTIRGNGGEDDKIVELLCKRRSEEIPVYANPKVFGGDGFWGEWEYTGKGAAVTDCWYSQIACWIHQDVVDSILKVNAGSKKVADSAVKRLLGVRFDSGNAVIETSLKTGDASVIELPGYTTKDKSGLCNDWTSRMDNEKLDIVHFSLAVVVDVKDVMRFIEALCSEKEHIFKGYKGKEPEQKFRHNQITVLQSNIDSIDLKAPEHLRYRYGSDAVVKLNLICQYIFVHEGYEPIMPELIKTELGRGRETDSGKKTGRSRSKSRRGR